MGALLLALTPLHVRVLFERVARPTLTVDGTLRAAPEVSLASLGHFELEVLEGPVRFIAPQVPRGPRLDLADFSYVSGPWKSVETWPREIETAAAGSRLTLDGWMSDRDFLFRTGPAQGLIRLTTAQGIAEIDLKAEQDGMRLVKFAATSRALILTRPFLWRPLSLGITGGEGLRQVEVMIGSYPVVSRAIPAGVARLDLSIGRKLLLDHLFPGLHAASKATARALLSLIACAVFGAGLMRLSRLRVTTGEFWLLATYSGAAAFAILAGSLAFFLPTRIAAPVVVVALATLSYCAWTRFPRQEAPPRRLSPALFLRLSRQPRWAAC